MRQPVGRARNPDICVFCTDPPLISVSGAAAARLRGARTVNWVMDLFPEVATELGVMEASGMAARIALALRDRSYRNAALTICPIESMENYLRTGGHAGPTATIRQWADDGDLRPVSSAANRLAREWGLSDTFVVGYSGNFGRAHEFSTVVAAAKRLEADPGVRFLLIGAGHRRAAVEAEVMQLGLTNVIFRPFQPKDMLAESLSVADVHLVSLLPSLEHCIIPSKFYGILAVGRPTIFIGSAQGEIARNLSQAGCGICVAPGDSVGLAEAIVALRDDPERAEAMGRRAHLLLERSYTRSRGVAEWTAAIAPLLAPGTSRTAEKSREAVQ
jgi:glycosyltransferase involved in cell wall biosynthesis